MKEKGEREREGENRRGGLVEKERKAGGLGQKAIFFPWLAPWTEVGVGGARAAAARRPSGHGCGRREGKRRRATRGFFSPLTLG
jgi:hypothetical protein